MVSPVYASVNAVLSAGYAGQGSSYYKCLCIKLCSLCKCVTLLLVHEEQHATVIFLSEAGNAVYDVLSGQYNPAGRTAVTWYTNDSQLLPMTDYSMVNRTYRYLTATPLYMFGYGLSYTKFNYSNFEVSKQTLYRVIYNNFALLLSYVLKQT